jgi:hypothetical protein
MARKDSEKDSERPHYYSQFWLDVAAGRRIIGGPRPEEETEQDEIEHPESPAARRAGRAASGHEEPVMSPPPSNGHSEAIEHPVAEPVVEEEVVDPEAGDLLLEEEPEYQDEDLEDTDIPDMDLSPLEDEDQEEEDFYDEDLDEEEDEDDLGWGGRGRKRNKPTRSPKQPPRKPKREPRRGY